MFIVFFVILLLTVFVTKWLEITREVQAVLSEVSDLLCFRWDAPWPSPPWTWQSGGQGLRSSAEYVSDGSFLC